MSFKYLLKYIRFVYILINDNFWNLHGTGSVYIVSSYMIGIYSCLRIHEGDPRKLKSVSANAKQWARPIQLPRTTIV